MNNEEVRRRRQEEILLKKKRLEEMKKSRSHPSEPETAPALPTLIDEIVVKSEPNPNSPIIPTIGIGETQPNFEVDKNNRLRLEKLRHFSYWKNPTNTISILSKEKVLYERQTQTDDLEPFMFTEESTTEALKAPSANFPGVENTDKGVVLKFEEPAVKKLLTESDKQSIFDKPDFVDFLATSSLRIERELDFLNQFNNVRSLTRKSTQSLNHSLAICDTTEPYEDDSVKSRPIVHVGFNSKNPGLFLTCHSVRTHAAVSCKGFLTGEGLFEEGSEGSGLVCVWSRDFHRRPEIKLVATSVVSIAVFGNDERDTVIGGCENGQIVIWDLHGGKASPVQKSSVTGKGHKYPILSIHITGSNTAFTMSIDGTICQWDLSRLVEPVYIMFLGIQQSLTSASSASSASNASATAESSFLFSPQSDKSSSSALNFSAMMCISLESKVFGYIGTGTGQLLRLSLPRKSNDMILQTNAHNGLITAISLCSQTASSKLKNYFLTASLDWCVKLWSALDITKPILEFRTPLYEYICDVQWSPTNSAVFITITSSGTLSVWNITKSVNEPVENIALLQENVEETSSNKKLGVTSPVALNKIAWSLDGNSVLVGDSLGIIRSVSVSAPPSITEESKIQQIVNYAPYITE